MMCDCSGAELWGCGSPDCPAAANEFQPRASDEQLRGYRIGEHNGPYGPMLPLHLAVERAQARLWKPLPRDPTIVHPGVFAEWVELGLIDEHGNVIPYRLGPRRLQLPCNLEIPWGRIPFRGA